MIDTVVFDACVLYPPSLRDFLLWLGYAGLVRPRWSEKIRSEWIESVLRNRPDLKRESLEQTCRKMDVHFPDSLTRGYESILPTLQLPDPKDRHVLAVAIHAKANSIVTFNLKDFPNTILQLYNIRAMAPDEFIQRLIQKESSRILRAVKMHRMGLTRPSKTVDEYLATLEKQRLPKTMAFLREHKEEI